MRKDVDQVLASLTPEQVARIRSQAPDPFLPGEGKFYCIICDKHFVDQVAHDGHLRGDYHRRQQKRLLEGGFTSLDAELAAGRGRPDNGPRLNRLS